MIRWFKGKISIEELPSCIINDYENTLIKKKRSEISVRRSLNHLNIFQMHQLNGMLRSKYMTSSVPIFLNRISLKGRKLSPMTNCFRTTKSTFPGSLENPVAFIWIAITVWSNVVQGYGDNLELALNYTQNLSGSASWKQNLNYRNFYSWVLVNPKNHMLQMDSYLKFRSHTSDKVRVWWVEIAELKGLLSSV